LIAASRSYNTAMDFVTDLFESAVTWLFVNAVQPLLFATDAMSWSERAYDATSFFLGGVLSVVAIALICLPLERLAPAQRVSDARNVRTDVAYTIINKLGLLPLLSFGLLLALFTPLDAWFRLQGFAPFSLEDFAPSLVAIPFASLLLYVVILDFAEYWRHRLQHRLHWWWQLHALHHAQRDMTFWSDDRNHILDEIIAAFWMAAIALLIGVPPAQFPLVVFATKFIESLSHANLRWNFGPLKYIVVSPQFHRVHHAIGWGHEGVKSGVNFAVVFSFWDKLFATADFRDEYPATGIRDQLTGRNYGIGFWETQWLGFKRLLGRA
jgi:sterol desaturase/sphingolipid hydroxylase (fatty acid hydroxylase superfamily)